MVTRSIWYDAIIYLYALSLLFYFSDVARANRSAKQIGTGLLYFVWVLQTAYLGYSLYEHLGRWVFSMFETLFLFSWVLITASLVISRFYRIELVVFFVNLFGLAVLALNFFSDSHVSPLIDQWNINDELLFIHVSLAVGSYAAYTVSFVLSGMYLFLHRKLKQKSWTASMKKMPSLEKIERYTYVSVVIGTPLLMLALSLGVAWVLIENNVFLLWDTKVINSLLVLCAYGFYLFQHHSLSISGPKLAKWNLAAFVIVLLNFILSNVFSGFHNWEMTGVGQ
ncbi:cytochrome c biogenesis protein [Paenibacillus lutrae]|uniref:Cytochrome C assembly protein n=1 Tax=Paenibacillus lutrae TaxID=2078573 RepID=A0A7X3FJ36_9BACL|nr:cytochrome c biogenesis protein CcsA [Paenibacillus lutrae]MVP00507.1 cytochrome C assembly protein [Paenibacillus lutrae]